MSQTPQGQTVPTSPATPSPGQGALIPDPRVVYVSFSAEISPHTTESLIAVMANCTNQRVSTVHLLFSTPGGNVMNGMNLYNILRALPFELITHNVGNVDSIGNAVFLAGARRFACPHSTFMFHGVGFDVVNPIRFEEKLLRERLTGIASDQRRIGAILAERTNLSQEVIEGLFLEAQTKDAAFAASTGIVHEVKNVQIPPGSNVVSLVFQR
jgi:ATP-dependent protease ClpP protease subunit